MRRATIEIESDAGPLLRDALSPEARRTIPRTKVRVGGKGQLVTIDIEAADVNALRAAINSYMRWVTVGLEAAGLGTDKRSK
jgi:tRNA threonylcarbamoyladenosine modification (KEOPS) complex  Pcc1 subunit